MEELIVNSGITGKTTQELNTMHKCLIRSSASRNTSLVTEIEEEIKRRVEEKKEVHG